MTIFRAGLRTGAAMVLVALLTLGIGTGAAGAHFADDAGWGHMALELIRWTAALGIVVSVLVAALWLRARWIESRES